jgi:hypothetical protein
MATSDRTQSSFKRHIVKGLDELLNDAVHPNSIYQMDDIREHLLKSIAVQYILFVAMLFSLSQAAKVNVMYFLVFRV